MYLKITRKYFYYVTFYFWQLSYGYRFLIVQIFQTPIFVSIIEKKLIKRFTKLQGDVHFQSSSDFVVILSPTLVYRHWDSDERVAKQNYYAGDHR